MSIQPPTPVKSERDIVLETIAFYHSGNRSASIRHGGEMCDYFGSNGKRCAFSRCCDPKKDKELMQHEGKPVPLEFDEYLREEYQGHNRNFWMALQILHDVSDNWAENGLSEDGKNTVELNFGFVFIPEEVAAEKTRLAQAG
jgi:hypothetical protein